MSERFDQDWDSLAHKLGYRSKYEMLHDLYVEQNLSLHQIGERIGCGPHCVQRNLQREGIDRRSRGGRNNSSNQTRKLFLFDQRFVLFAPFGIVVKVTRVSTTLLYKYRNLMKGDNNGVLHNQPDSGSGTLLDAE